MVNRIIRKVANKLHLFISPAPAKYLAERYPQYRIGKGSYGDLNVLSWGEDAQLIVGSYTSVAAGVKVFLGGEHRIDWVTTYPFNALWESARQYKGHPKTKGNVSIGSDVWIGTEAIILSGVTVGDGAVIGARAVVTKDVPPYAIVAGNPAKIIKYRFEENIVQQLLAIGWWTWSDAEIRAAMPLLLDENINLFVKSTITKHGGQQEVPLRVNHE